MSDGRSPTVALTCELIGRGLGTKLVRDCALVVDGQTHRAALGRWRTALVQCPDVVVVTFAGLGARLTGFPVVGVNLVEDLRLVVERFRHR